MAAGFPIRAGSAPEKAPTILPIAPHGRLSMPFTKRLVP
jgi:hypothetical protein